MKLDKFLNANSKEEATKRITEAENFSISNHVSNVEISDQSADVNQKDFILINLDILVVDRILEIIH